MVGSVLGRAITIRTTFLQYTIKLQYDEDRLNQYRPSESLNVVIHGLCLLLQKAMKLLMDQEPKMPSKSNLQSYYYEGNC